MPRAKKRYTLKELDLVGLRNISERTGVPYHIVRSWHSFNDRPRKLPDPDFTVDNKSVWLWEAVMDFLREDNRTDAIEHYYRVWLPQSRMDQERNTQ